MTFRPSDRPEPQSLLPQSKMLLGILIFSVGASADHFTGLNASRIGYAGELSGIVSGKENVASGKYAGMSNPSFFLTLLKPRTLSYSFIFY
jgi:hypothetical protein